MGDSPIPRAGAAGVGSALLKGDAVSLMLPIVLITAVVSVVLLPIWPYSRRWGLYPLTALLFGCLLACALLLVGTRS